MKENGVVYDVWERERKMLLDTGMYDLGYALTDAATETVVCEDILVFDDYTRESEVYRKLSGMADIPEVVDAVYAITGCFLEEEKKETFLYRWAERQKCVLDKNNRIRMATAMYCGEQFTNHISRCYSEDQIEMLYLVLEILTGYTSFAELLFWHMPRYQ